MTHWIEKANIYHIYTLGFCGCEQYGKDAPETPVNRIKKVIEWIPHIKSMNMNAVYFGPVFDSVEHGYDTRDYYLLDRRLGTNADFKEVCGELRKNGIRIILDGVFNHVGRGHFAFQDLIEKGQASQYKDWFAGVNFSGRSPYGDSFSYEGWNGHYNLVKLNLYNKNVTEHLLSAVKMWIEEFGIDGIRFDAADCLADNFIKDICRFARGIKHDFWLMGEIIHGSAKRWANSEMFDSITNYQCYKGIYSSHNDRNYFEIAHSIDYQFGQNGSLYLYNFLDNHDVSRIASILNNPSHLHCCYTLMYMMHGVPSVYYGSEFGIPGIKGRGHDADLPVRPELSLDDIAKGNGKLLKHISALGAIRKENSAVQSGSYAKLELNNQTFLFRREKEGNKVYIALNISDTSHTFRIQTDYKMLSDLLSGRIFEVSGGFASVTVPQNQSMVLTAADEEAAKTFISGKEGASEDKAVSAGTKDEQGANEPAEGRKPAPAPKNNGITGIGVPEGRKIVINGHYKHFKGGDYIVLNVAKDHEDCSEQAVYMQLGSKPVIWVRPLEMFLEDVDDHGNIKPRFKLIEE